MITYLLKIRYIGTRYQGFQSQPHGHTVQDELNKVIQTIYKNNFVTLGMSRTDSGVHAKEQYVSLRTNEKIDISNMANALDKLLPDDIGFMSIEEIEGNFHPLSAKKLKTYKYRIYKGEFRDPFLAEQSWHDRRPYDIEVMQKALKIFEGKHDFTAFCASDSGVKSKTRTVQSTSVNMIGENMLEFEFIGEGFLKQMIRSIVGLVVQAGLHKIEVDSIKEILYSKIRTPQVITAPARGLTLEKIDLYQSH